MEINVKKSLSDKCGEKDIVLVHPCAVILVGEGT